jgi:hypothetical protein
MALIGLKALCKQKMKAKKVVNFQSTQGITSTTKGPAAKDGRQTGSSLSSISCAIINWSLTKWRLSWLHMKIM